MKLEFILLSMMDFSWEKINNSGEMKVSQLKRYLHDTDSTVLANQSCLGIWSIAR